MAEKKRVKKATVGKNDFTDEICLTVYLLDGEKDWFYFETKEEAKDFFYNNFTKEVINE